MLNRFFESAEVSVSWHLRYLYLALLAAAVLGVRLAALVTG